VAAKHAKETTVMTGDKTAKPGPPRTLMQAHEELVRIRPGQDESLVACLSPEVGGVVCRASKDRSGSPSRVPVLGRTGARKRRRARGPDQSADTTHVLTALSNCVCATWATKKGGGW
jgi:hypothetical protein